MYKSFRVKNFRCFKDLQINDLGRVNLIAGPNNTGKTALMEAMYLHTKPLSPGELSNLQQVRGIDFSDDDRLRSWRQFFYRMDSDKTIEIEGYHLFPKARPTLCIYECTLASAAQWVSACMDAARNLAAHIPSFTPAYMRVFGAMLSFAKTSGMCWAKQENITRAAGCCDRTVRRAMTLFRKLGLIRFEGYHYSRTCRYSFDLGDMSDKLSFALVRSVVALVCSLVDDVASEFLPPTTRQLALRMPDRAPP